MSSLTHAQSQVNSGLGFTGVVKVYLRIQPALCRLPE